MPFFKYQNKRLPLVQKWNATTSKNGLRKTILFVNGSDYVGLWFGNEKQGKGTIHTNCKRLYAGDWDKNKVKGYGITANLESDGNYATQYIGDWVNGRRQGYGISHYDDGSYYEGEWHGGKRSGHGRMFFKDGTFYEGQWYNDKFDGVGLFLYANGNRYEGEWSCGLKHGRGRYFHTNRGQLQQGIWFKGNAQCTAIVDREVRQAAQKPTPYPIPKCEMKNCDPLYSRWQKKLMKDIDKSKTNLINKTTY